MKRTLFALLLLALVAWWAASFEHHDVGGLAVVGDADGAAAMVSVNGRVLGRMAIESSGSAPPDSTLVAKGPGSVVTSRPYARQTALTSRLDARVPVLHSNEIVVVSATGVRLATSTPLGESTRVQVSFRDRHLTVTPAGRGAIPAEADTSAESDD